MGIDLREMYRNERVLELQLCKAAAEGTLEAVILPLIPRNPAKRSESDLVNGTNAWEPEGVWVVSTENAAQGGLVSRARVSTAAHAITFQGCRLATRAEIDQQEAAEQARLTERVATGRNLSRREDSRYGKKD